MSDEVSGIHDDAFQRADSSLRRTLDPPPQTTTQPNTPLVVTSSSKKITL